MELENDQIELMVAADGSVTWRDAANVYQFSNDTTGVTIYTPYSGAGISALVNVRLPDGTVLQEAPMTLTGTAEIGGARYYVWTYDFACIITGLSGKCAAAPITVSFRFSDHAGKWKTTNQVHIPIQPSLQGEEMCIDPSTADALNAKIDSVATEVANHEERITALENTMVRKVLRDFTVDAETGAGVKYYTDGTTATVQFPTGGGGPIVRTEWVTVVGFTADSFVGGELAFGPDQTGFSDADYVALLDRSGSEVYEAGGETTPSEREGFWQTANSFFKGSDGSILLRGVNKPFDGRLVLLGGSAFSGEFVTGGHYDAATNSVVLEFVNGETDRIALADSLKTLTYAVGTNTITATSLLGVETRLQLPDAVLGARYDAAQNALMFTTVTGQTITVSLSNSVKDMAFDAAANALVVSYLQGADKSVPLPRPTTAERTKLTYAVGDWQGSAAPYTLVIPESRHGRGVTPTWEFYDDQIFGVTVAANGDMTVSSNVRKAFTIIII